ncbi:restriction endonuclease [Actinacidiphila oryziradicis]|uniref:Restriction endonuclease n=1 Tax=Actinacidiphila oryziradicis TaxID=2571141 RepID=A0A4U0RHT9_9ACTN|nr:restriction endonuclease [Actinacidiphila oryziradicis]
MRMRDIRRHGATIAEPDPGAALWHSDVPERYRLQAGDVLMGAVLLSDSAAVALVREQDLPAAASNTTIVLRPTVVLAPEHMRLILAYLRSVVRYLAYGAVGMGRIRPKDLAALALPGSDEPLAAALDDLEAARQQMNNWSAEAADLTASAFADARNMGQARQRIIEAGQILRLRAETAAQLDDFVYIVRTRFPYPIALRWRETEARRSADDLGPAYDAVLETAEILLCYSALVTAALAHSAAIDLTSVAALRSKLANSQGGPGLGEWTAVLQEISGKKKRRGLEAEHPLHELGAFFADETVSAARKRLSGRRNDQSHLRRVDPIDLPGALRESYDDLRLLLTRARFLADWPLNQITSVTWNAFRDQATVGYRRLMGDHAVVPTETMQYPSSALETGSLYLADRDHRPHLLRPFLTGQICPICRTWSTFHADKGDHKLVLKSLEHGHCLPDPPDTEPLRQAGLL